MKATITIAAALSFLGAIAASYAGRVDGGTAVARQAPAVEQLQLASQ